MSTVVKYVLSDYVKLVASILSSRLTSKAYGTKSYVYSPGYSPACVQTTDFGYEKSALFLLAFACIFSSTYMPSGASTVEAQVHNLP